jgi:hypothetical protein
MRRMVQNGKVVQSTHHVLVAVPCASMPLLPEDAEGLKGDVASSIYSVPILTNGTEQGDIVIVTMSSTPSCRMDANPRGWKWENKRYANVSGFDNVVEMTAKGSAVTNKARGRKPFWFLEIPLVVRGDGLCVQEDELMLPKLRILSCHVHGLSLTSPN